MFVSRGKYFISILTSFMSVNSRRRLCELKLFHKYFSHEPKKIQNRRIKKPRVNHTKTWIPEEEVNVLM